MYTTDVFTRVYAREKVCVDFYVPLSRCFLTFFLSFVFLLIKVASLHSFLDFSPGSLLVLLSGLFDHILRCYARRWYRYGTCELPRATPRASAHGHRHPVRVPKVQQEKTASRRRGYLRNQVQSFGVQHSKVHSEFTQFQVASQQFKRRLRALS